MIMVFIVFAVTIVTVVGSIFVMALFEHEMKDLK